MDARGAKSAPPPSRPSYTSAAPSYAPTSPRVVVREYHYHTRYDDGDYSSGVLAGMLMQQLSQPRPSGDYDREQYEREMDDMRAKLRDVQSRGDVDSATKQQIDSTLVATESKSSGLGFWFYAIVFVIIAVLFGYFARVYYVREKYRMRLVSHAAGESAPTSGPIVEKAVAQPDDYRTGQRLTLGSVPFVLASAYDTDVPDLSGSYSVVAVSAGRIYGNTFDRAYFGEGGKNFLERFARYGEVQLRAFSLVDERFPANDDEWSFFLGTEGKDAYIGLPTVDYGDKSRHYERVWAATSDAPIRPVIFDEHRSATGVVMHAAMLYSRTLDGASKPALVEYLYIEKVADRNGASIKVWVGLDIAAMAAQVA